MSRIVLVVLALTALSITPAHAYIGPGLGAGTIGVILGLLGSVLLAAFAFFWYPIKRALFGNKETDKQKAGEKDEDDLALEQAPQENEKPE